MRIASDKATIVDATMQLRCIGADEHSAFLRRQENGAAASVIGKGRRGQAESCYQGVAYLARQEGDFDRKNKQTKKSRPSFKVAKIANRNISCSIKCLALDIGGEHSRMSPRRRRRRAKY